MTTHGPRHGPDPEVREEKMGRVDVRMIQIDNPVRRSAFKVESVAKLAI